MAAYPASMLPEDSVRGVELAVALDAMNDVEPADAGDVLDMAVMWAKVAAFATARSYDRLAQFARRPDDHPHAPAVLALGARVREYDVEEVAARLHVTPRRADDLLDVATALAGRLPATREALAAGDIDPARAGVMVAETADLDRDEAADVEAAVLSRGQRQTSGRFRTACRQRALAARPDLVKVRTAKARADRRVRSYPGDWDSSDLYAKLPAQHAAVIDTVVTAAARRMLADAPDGDTLTMDQARADALTAPFLVALGIGVLDGPTPIRLMTPPGGRLELVVRASTATLAGDADEPGELDGHGPISADLARDLAQADDLPVRVLVTDVEPAPPADTDGYRPSPRLAAYIRDRDRTCVAPGCSRSAAHCDLDHTIAWPEGPTSHSNLGPLCRRNHRMKQHPGFSLEQPEPGRFRWRYPTGHTYDIDPHDDRPAHGPPDG